MQSSCSINQGDICAAFTGRGDCIESYCSRIRILALLNNGNPVTFTPDRQLIDCSGPESNCRSQYHLSAVRFIEECEVPERCGLTDTIGCYQQDHMGFV